MEAGFWHQKWATGDIGFHAQEVNPSLREHFGKLQMAAGARVFLPLCGKTRDIAWLLDEGYRVTGAELSELAIKALFDELGVVPEITDAGKHLCYQSRNIRIFVGDIFDLSAKLLGPIDAIYDRAALVALPVEMRARYAAHLIDITDAAQQLLLSCEYNQQLMNGPPFSVHADEIKRLYSVTYDVRPLETHDVPGGLRGKVPATETVWALQMAHC
ncbi:MAG: thiopurine S-methyltransferase [Gammaproteobacteria bacterium]|nr:thiopurine S-methyltransferase [Gammaproteobacteria bacterium]